MYLFCCLVSAAGLSDRLYAASATSATSPSSSTLPREGTLRHDRPVSSCKNWWPPNYSQAFLARTLDDGQSPANNNDPDSNKPANAVASSDIDMGRDKSLASKMDGP